MNKSIKRVNETRDEEVKPKQLKEQEKNNNLDKICEIINKNFNQEILYKQFEIEKINEVTWVVY